MSSPETTSWIEPKHSFLSIEIFRHPSFLQSEAPCPCLPAGRHRAGPPGNVFIITGSALTPLRESVTALPAGNPAGRQVSRKPRPSEWGQGAQYKRKLPYREAPPFRGPLHLPVKPLSNSMMLHALRGGKLQSFRYKQSQMRPRTMSTIGMK
jgi:hypothetical protein